MTKQQCVRWEPLTNLDVPCADIAFSFQPPWRVTVRMRFSNVRDGQANDLELCFSKAIPLRWESESYGLVHLPKPLPTCRAEKWANWTFPLLRVDHSQWLAEHDARIPVAAEDRVHFALVTMNDLLHVLALPDVEAQWVPPIA